MPLHLVGQDLFLRLISVFEKLLDNIVAEDVRHQLQGVGLNFTENLFFLITVGGFQFLLNETGSVLISTEFNYMVVNVLAEGVSYMSSKGYGRRNMRERKSYIP